MEKRKIITILSILVLTMFLTCNICYASNADIDKFANEQLQYYIEGYKTAYQDYGFSSQSEMENSKLGYPIHLYWFDKAAIENYTNGDLPLVDRKSWLYPIYGQNNQIKSAIQISIRQDGTPYSIFGGYTADVLSEYFQANESLLKEKDISSLKAVLQEDISSLLLVYKKDGQELTVPYLINQKNNGLQHKKTYNSYEIGQIYKEKILKNKEYIKNAKPGEELVGGITVTPPTATEHLVKVSLLVLLLIGIASTIIFFLMKRKKAFN